SAGGDLLTSRRWGDVIKYGVSCGILSGSPFYLGMNRKVWDKLPADIQKIFNDMSSTDTGMKMYDEYNYNVDKEVMDIWTKQMGGTWAEMSDADLTELEKRSQPLVDAFVKQMDGKGYPFSAMHQKLVELVKKYEVK
ncbi:MAG: hypothetical protein PHR56_08990, partial [Dehalococcoidales bacterium]|nr:hypothetical protein [Dehalococcoidales bacterium]